MLLGCSTEPVSQQQQDSGFSFLANQPSRFTECRTNYLEQYVCLGTVTENSVEILANTHTWLSWPPALYAAVVHASGCEDSVERFFISAERSGYRRVDFSIFANGASLVDGFYTYVSVGPHCDLRNRTLTVEIYSQEDYFPRQIFYIQRRQHISP